MTLDVKKHNKVLILQNKNIFVLFQKSIAAKNQEILDIKLHQKEQIELSVFEPPLTLNLSDIDNSLRENHIKEFPLFNPLFGEQFKRTFC